MKIAKNFFLWGAGVVLLSQAAVNPLYAFDLGFKCDETYLDLAGAWRRDHLSSRVTTSGTTATDVVKADELNIYQIGLRGCYTPSFNQCEFCGLGAWLDGLFIKGSAYWGWANSGEFVQNIGYDTSQIVAPITSQTDLAKGDIHRGHTWDYSVGGGYLVPICEFAKLGPTGGWSYHRLKFKATNILGTRTNNNTATSTINQTMVSVTNPFAYLDEGAEFTSKWTGPWVGLQGNFYFCDVTLIASYEYHWAHWHGSFDLGQPDLKDCVHYSDRRHGKRGWGHEATINAYYDICDCWNLGLGLSYEYYHVKTMGFAPAAGLTAVGCASSQENMIRTTWHTFAVTADVGYFF